MWFYHKGCQGNDLVGGVTNASQGILPKILEKNDRLVCKVPLKMWLSEGNYFLTLGMAAGSDGDKIDFIDDAINFRVVGPPGFFTTSIVNLDAEYELFLNPGAAQTAHAYERHQ